MSNRGKLFATLYQIAGHRLLSSDDLTDGQKERLDTLILDVLSDPDRYKASVVRDLYEEALKQ